MCAPMSAASTPAGTVPLAIWHGICGYRSSSAELTCRYQAARSSICPSSAGLTVTDVSNLPTPDGGAAVDMGPVSRVCRDDDPSAAVMVTSLTTAESSDTGENPCPTCSAFQLTTATGGWLVSAQFTM